MCSGIIYILVLFILLVCIKTLAIKMSSSIVAGKGCPLFITFTSFCYVCNLIKILYTGALPISE